MAKENENGTVRYVFIYDADGNPHELHYYNGYDDTTPTKYFYVLNLQGDVIQLRDTSNAIVANYTYDAWGRLLSVKNASGSTISDASHIANVNPIRYRGYFYDTETKLYYCNNRYYDPQIKRFINADVLLSTGTGFLGYNMFAYCNNNPVMYCDPSGCVVTDWDRAHLDAYELEALQLYTDRWHSSWISAEGRAYQHQLAVELRSKYLSEGEFVCANGYVGAYLDSDFLFVLYDNDRFRDETPFHEQIIVISGHEASFDIKDFEFSAGFISGDLYTGGWEFEYVDISLFDVGHVEAGATMSKEGFCAQAIASAWSPSASVTIFGVEFGIGAEVLSVGAEASFTSKGFKIGAALLGGVEITINWD